MKFIWELNDGKKNKTQIYNPFFKVRIRRRNGIPCKCIFHISSQKIRFTISIPKFCTPQTLSRYHSKEFRCNIWLASCHLLQKSVVQRLYMFQIWSTKTHKGESLESRTSCRLALILLPTEIIHFSFMESSQP